jgi:hypothetical protein
LWSTKFSRHQKYIQVVYGAAFVGLFAELVVKLRHVGQTFWSRRLLYLSEMEALTEKSLKPVTGSTCQHPIVFLRRQVEYRALEDIAVFL